MATPVVFVHGLWLHADSWGAWVDLFREQGYEPSRPAGRVTPTRSRRRARTPSRSPATGSTTSSTTTPSSSASCPAKPIVIGHSFGGLIVQRLLGQDLAAAAVAIDPAPIKGVLFLPPSALRVASIALRNPSNRNKAVALTQKQFRYGFGNALSEAESNELFEKWTIPSPGKPLFEAAAADFSPHSPAKVNTDNTTRGPLLITAGGKDHTVPASISRTTRKLYHKSPAVTDLREFADRGHSLRSTAAGATSPTSSSPGSARSLSSPRARRGSRPTARRRASR